MLGHAIAARPLARDGLGRLTSDVVHARLAQRAPAPAARDRDTAATRP